MISLEPIALILSLAVSGISAQPAPSDITGKWICGPYKMDAESFITVATDYPIYNRDGSFYSEGHARYILDGAEEINVKVLHKGTWDLKGDVIEILYSSAEFISSDSPFFSVAMGQAALDEQMDKKSWAKKRVISFAPNLVTLPIDASSKAAEIEVSCAKA